MYLNIRKMTNHPPSPGAKYNNKNKHNMLVFYKIRKKVHAMKLN